MSGVQDKQLPGLDKSEGLHVICEFLILLERRTPGFRVQVLGPQVKLTEASQGLGLKV